MKAFRDLPEILPFGVTVIYFLNLGLFFLDRLRGKIDDRQKGK